VDDNPQTEPTEADEPTGEEREQVAQEGRLQQVEEEEAQEGA